MPTAFRSGGIPLPVRGPSLGGLAFWTGGAGSVITSQNDTDGNARMVGWSNLVNRTNNGDIFEALNTLNGGPYTGLESLDGVPGLTWRTDVDHTQEGHIDTVVPSGNPQPMKTTTGATFGYAGGRHEPRSVLALVIPRAGAFAITGGTVSAFFDSPCNTQLFDLESIATPDAFYAQTTTFDWRANIGTPLVLQAPDTPQATYDDVPLLLEWSTSGGTDISFYVNGVQLPLTPSVLDLSPGGSLSWILGTGGKANDQAERWRGAMFEYMTYDFKLSTTPTARTRTYTYYADRYPSAGIVVP